MIIHHSSCRDEDDGIVVSALIESREATSELHYHLPHGASTTRMDPFVIAGLLPAMWVGEPLHAQGVISPKLLQGLATVQEVFHSWSPNLKLVNIEAEAVQAEAFGERPRGVACFFSGGVDSFYSLYKHQAEIDALVLVYGFELGLRDPAVRAEVSVALRGVAAELHKPLIEIETNIRDLVDAVVPWSRSHGAAMASIAHFLSPLFHKIYVPSSYTYAQLFPHGSHPLLDPLWGSETLELVHDGNERPRVEKVERIAGSELALKNLRVCRVQHGMRNCGRCEKCVRTMIALEVAGALDRCPTFDRPLEPEAVARLPLGEPHTDTFLLEDLEALEERGTHPELARAIRTALGDSPEQVAKYQQLRIVQLERALASTQAWAAELQSDIAAKDRELERVRGILPVRLLRRLRRALAR